MYDRFDSAPIFERRQQEWTSENIKGIIDELFKNVELVEGWKFLGSEWKAGKSSRNEELKRNVYSVIEVKVQDNLEEIHIYSFAIPDLIEHQFFYIGGYLKTPIFQLIDKPIVRRDNLVILRTNCLTMRVKEEKSKFVVELFNKNIPIDLLVSILHTPEEIQTFAESKNIDHPYIQWLLTQCNDRWVKTPEELIIELGSYYSDKVSEFEKKGKSAAFSLKIAYDIDPLVTRFFTEKSILLELVNEIYNGNVVEDRDLKLENKRIRFAEYIMSPLIKKIYDLLLSMKQNNERARKIKFNINQSIILENCNVSSIVHFNFPINPINELASFCQCSLVGPGGFKKDTVPAHLRNLDPSHKGRICPADTPDREGCGVILNMIPTVIVDEVGNFGEPNKKIVCSYPISLVPFMENDDPVRLQMASSQYKQSILLKNSQKPIVRSGIENKYLEKGTFLYKAEQDGIVAHLDAKFMIVIYNDKSANICPVGNRYLSAGIIDIILPKFSEGDEFKQGDILCQSKFLKDGELSIGQNLLTGIAIWKGFNYEDGIVISDAVVKQDKFTSFHGEKYSYDLDRGQVLLSLDAAGKYQPFPAIGQYIKKGEPYARIKTLDGEDGFESINIESSELTAKVDCIVTAVEIYPNIWNKDVREFDHEIRRLMTRQTDKFITLYEKLKSYIGKDAADKFITLKGLSKLDCANRQGRYSHKGKQINGIRINIHVIHTERIGIGDKIANRHGNKGVIAKIIPENEMPFLEDGRRLEVILNPLGIISRMNVGQLFELHISEALYQLSIKMLALETMEQKLSLLKGFLDLIDKTEDKWITTQIMTEFENGTINESSLYLIQPPFQAIHPRELKAVIEYAGSAYKYTVIDGANNIPLKNNISVGYLYLLKLIHRASDKMSGRSIGPYSKKTLQPLGGKSRLGGHKLGEMEVWALMGQGAKNLIRDFLTVHSDSPGKKNKFLSGVLQNPDISDDVSDEKPQSLKLFESYLRILGIDIDEEEAEEIATIRHTSFNPEQEKLLDEIESELLSDETFVKPTSEEEYDMSEDMED